MGSTNNQRVFKALLLKNTAPLELPGVALTHEPVNVVIQSIAPPSQTKKKAVVP